MPMAWLWGMLLLTIVLSAFFSGSETAVTSLNQYRLAHFVRKKHPGALRLWHMLAKPERILSVILIGNTFANIMAATIASMLANHYLGEPGVWMASLILTIVILVFSEVTPKTIAVHFSQQWAFFASIPIRLLQGMFYPLVWMISGVANILMRILGLKVESSHRKPGITHEELKGVVRYNRGLSKSHQGMMLGVLDLASMDVNDAMVPRHEMPAIDIEWPWHKIVDHLTKGQQMATLIYRGSIDHPQGFMLLPNLVKLLITNSLNKHTLHRSLSSIHYVPEGTSLNQQLLHFQQSKIDVGLIVDEYGGILGSLSLDDIVDAVIGDFSKGNTQSNDTIELCPDGRYEVSGSFGIRDLNRIADVDLPVDGPNTISGLVIEHLESIPNQRVTCLIAGYRIEVKAWQGNTITTVYLDPQRCEHND